MAALDEALHGDVVYPRELAIEAPIERLDRSGGSGGAYPAPPMGRPRTAPATLGGTGGRPRPPMLMDDQRSVGSRSSGGGRPRSVGSGRGRPASASGRLTPTRGGRYSTGTAPDQFLESLFTDERHAVELYLREQTTPEGRPATGRSDREM